MRRRPTRHGRTERNRYQNRQVSWRELAVAYGAVLFMPILFWLVANPVRAASIAVIVGVVDVMARVGIRVVNDRHRARTA